MTKLSPDDEKVKSLTNPLVDRDRPVGDLLREAHRCLVAHLDRALRDAGWADVRAPHASVLATIDPAGTRLATMVERAGRTKQATAELAGHLVARGYLDLVPDPTDRRAKLHVPTDRGLALLSSCAAVVTEYESWLDDVLGAGTVTELTHILRAIVAHPPR